MEKRKKNWIIRMFAFPILLSIISITFGFIYTWIENRKVENKYGGGKEK